jgi:hypothetical protein
MPLLIRLRPVVTYPASWISSRSDLESMAVEDLVDLLDRVDAFHECGGWDALAETFTWSDGVNIPRKLNVIVQAIVEDEVARYGVTEAAKRLGVDKSTLYRWRTLRGVPKKLGPG